nr:cysteine-rich receptor-like protein kinase [Tanacetum cinerariifolium]
MVDVIIAWAKKYKKHVMFLKLDFEKAFYSLSWSILFSVLEQMGFSSKWRTCIYFCLDSAFALVLVNGSPIKEFNIQREFEVSTLIPQGCNSSFIARVPKVDDPLVVGDFRPISLIGKIIAKILANRLSRVVSSVVGDVQMAYIKGRQLIDGPLMVDVIIAWAKKYKKHVMFLKLDFEKAFYSLSWSILFSVLEQMGFSSKWRTCIYFCLDSAFALVLVNGSPIKEFNIQRGLRKGDPLSLFCLFWQLKL